MLAAPGTRSRDPCPITASRDEAKNKSEKSHLHRGHTPPSAVLHAGWDIYIPATAGVARGLRAAVGLAESLVGTAATRQPARHCEVATRAARHGPCEFQHHRVFALLSAVANSRIKNATLY